MIFRKKISISKACVKMGSLKNFKNRLKAAECWTLSLIPSATRILILDVKISIAWKNITNSLRYATETSKIVDFLYNNPSIMVTWQTPRADKISKIVSKVLQEDFNNTKIILIVFAGFFTNFSTVRRVVPPPGAINS